MSINFESFPYEYICFHNTDYGFKIDEFTLFAIVISKTDKMITYKRFMDFGRIESPCAVHIPAEEFKKYYDPITDEIRRKCIKAYEEMLVNQLRKEV